MACTIQDKACTIQEKEITFDPMKIQMLENKWTSENSNADNHLIT
jgi:hypothetical protein